VRGRWGEMQLRRVVEAAGMLAHCDFAEQTTLSADGRLSRPDLIVKLAGGKQVIVDAKAPLQAYLEALEADSDDARAERFRAHARQIKDHVTKLSAKGYWTQLDATPEFVVMFIPGEPFYGAALEHDPTLIEEAAKRQVILATPTTLIAVLWAVAHGWREERLAENAREISELGSDLYRRLCTLGDHVAKVGRSLGTAVGAYNELAGSLESRVFPSARRFRDLGAAPIGDLKSLTTLDHTVRPATAPELLPAPEADADAA
jgi:DNA recombination protein RmuC